MNGRGCADDCEAQHCRTCGAHLVDCPGHPSAPRCSVCGDPVRIITRGRSAGGAVHLWIDRRNYEHAAEVDR